VALGRVPVRAASVGFIALIGIAVLNGVVLISYINRLLAEEGMSLHDAVREGAKRRMTPVVLTATIAAFGWCRSSSPPGRAPRSSGRWRWW
jgi:Cu/Ag efflux pump CusA